MKIRSAEPTDSGALCDLMERCPMGQSIRLTFERRPDYFLGAQIQAEQPLILLGDGPDGIFGVFAAGSRRVFVNGTPTKIRYLSDLRIDPEYRGKTWLARGYRHLRSEVFESEEFAQTLILSDNAEVMKLLSSRRAGLPGYFPHGEYLTHFLGDGAPHLDGSIQVKPATSGHIPEMQCFFDQEAPRRSFFPCYRFNELTSNPYYLGQQISDYLLAYRGSELVGFFGVWDQSSFRQSRIHGYGGAIRWMRPLVNRVSPIRLPRPGSVLPLRYAHSIVILDDDAEILRQLLAVGMNLAKKAGFQGNLVVGLDAKDPLNEAVSRFRKRTFRGRHYLVSFAQSVPSLPRPFAFEVARV